MLSASSENWFTGEKCSVGGGECWSPCRWSDAAQVPHEEATLDHRKAAILAATIGPVGSQL